MSKTLDNILAGPKKRQPTPPPVDASLEGIPAGAPVATQTSQQAAAPANPVLPQTTPAGTFTGAQQRRPAQPVLSPLPQKAPAGTPARPVLSPDVLPKIGPTGPAQPAQGQQGGNPGQVSMPRTAGGGTFTRTAGTPAPQARPGQGGARTTAQGQGSRITTSPYYEEAVKALKDGQIDVIGAIDRAGDALPKQLTPEEKAKEEKRRKRETLFANLSEGVQALANLYFTTKWSPNSYDPKNSATKAVDAKWDKIKAERNKADKDRVNLAMKKYGIISDGAKEIMKIKQTEDQWNYKKEQDKAAAEHQKQREKIADERYTTEWKAKEDQRGKDNAHRDRAFAENQRQFNANQAQRRKEHNDSMGIQWARFNYQKQKDAAGGSGKAGNNSGAAGNVRTVRSGKNRVHYVGGAKGGKADQSLYLHNGDVIYFGKEAEGSLYGYFQKCRPAKGASDAFKQEFEQAKRSPEKAMQFITKYAKNNQTFSDDISSILGVPPANSSQYETDSWHTPSAAGRKNQPAQPPSAQPQKKKYDPNDLLGF